MRVVNTEGRSQLLQRSTKHLYPIEVSKNQSKATPADGDQESNDVDDTDTRADTIGVRRSRRTAAATGELIIGPVRLCQHNLKHNIVHFIITASSNSSICHYIGV